MTWTADIPLRTTAAWRRADPVDLVPLRYGRTSGALLPYDNERRVFVWAGHGSAGISAVRADGVAVTGWQWRNGQDLTGQPCTFVEFGARMDGDLLADGVGALDSVRGGVIELAADVVLDLIRRSGLGIPASRLRAFRAECQRLGLKVSGSIDSAVSLQRACAEVCASVGAVFGAASPGIARVWPLTSPGGVPRAVVTRADVAQCVADDADVYTVVEADFGPEAGTRGECAVTVPRAELRFDRRTLRLRLPWCVDVRTALAVCTRRAEWVARPRWTVSADLAPGDALPFGRLRAGESVRVLWHAAAADVVGLAESVEWSIDTGRHGVTTTVPVGPVPAVRVLRPLADDTITPPPPPGAGVITTDDLVTITTDDLDPITLG